MNKYRVVIPYNHEFIVEAKNKEEALKKSHNQEGKIIGYDDEKAFIEVI